MVDLHDGESEIDDDTSDCSVFAAGDVAIRDWYSDSKQIGQ